MHPSIHSIVYFSCVTWLGVFLLRCKLGTDSPSNVLRGRTSGVLLVLLADEPEIDAWIDATVLACSGGTYLREKHLNEKRTHTQQWVYFILIKNVWSHFILGGLNYHVLRSKHKYNVLIVLILYFKSLLLLLRWDTAKVRGGFGGIGRFKGGLKCNG